MFECIKVAQRVLFISPNFYFGTRKGKCHFIWFVENSIFFFLFFILFSFLCTDIKKRKEGKKNWENFDLFSSSNIPLDYCECESSFCPTWITAIWNLIYFRFIFIFNGLKKHLNKRTRTHWQQKKRKKILLVRCVDQHYWIYTTKRFHQRRLFTWGAQYSKQTDETILKKKHST